MQSTESPCCRNMHVLFFCLALFTALWMGQTSLFAQEAASSPLLLGSISGTVRDADENPLAGITVRLYTNTSGIVYRTTTTDATGTYTFQQLPTGLYRVGFSSDGEPYVPAYYLFGVNLEQAVKIPVNADAVSGIDATLQLGGSISGTIALAREAQLIYGSITAYPTGGEAPLHSLYFHGPQLEEQAFEFSGISPDRDYQLRATFYVFEGSYPSAGSSRSYVEYYDDELVENRAKTLRLAAGEVISGVHFVMGQNQYFGEIYGRVTNAEGAPLPDVRVTGHLSVTYGWSEQHSVRSDSNGHYALQSLTAGDYALCFTPASDALYAERCYPQAYLADITTPLSLTARSVITGVNIQLDRLGEISGQVVLDSPSPDTEELMGSVTLYRQGTSGLSFVSDHTFLGLPGAFSFTRLTPGTYQLFAFVRGDDKQYGEFYDNTFSLEEATKIVLEPSTVISNLELSLGENPAYGTIQGRVTDANTGLPVSNARAYVSAVPTGAIPYTQDSSNAAGNYQLNGLLPGSYALCFYTETNRYKSTCYQDQAPITITHGLTLNNLDIALHPTSFISGTVHMTGDILERSASLVLWEPSFFAPEQWFPSRFYPLLVDDVESAGTSYPYTIFGIPPGQYRLGIRISDDDSYFSAWQFFYPATPSVNEATDIEIIDGQGLTGIDITLPDRADASIAGQVTYFGQPQSGIRVEVERSGNSDVLVYVRTNEQGEYQVNGLRPGTYRLRFVDPTGIIPPSYYADGSGTLAIYLADGSQATHANFDLGTKRFMRYIINQLFLPLIEQP